MVILFTKIPEASVFEFCFRIIKILSTEIVIKFTSIATFEKNIEISDLLFNILNKIPTMCPYFEKCFK